MESINVVINDSSENIHKRQDDDDILFPTLEICTPNTKCSQVKATSVNSRHTNSRNHSSAEETDRKLLIDPIVNNVRDILKDDWQTVSVEN